MFHLPQCRKHGRGNDQETRHGGRHLSTGAQNGESQYLGAPPVSPELCETQREIARQFLGWRTDCSSQ